MESAAVVRENLEATATALPSPKPPRALHSGADFDAGDHVCCLHRTDDERNKLVSQYFRRALERNDKCLYLVGGSTADRVRRALQADGIDVTAAEGRGQLVFQTAAEAYLRNSEFVPGAMIEMLGKAERAAMAEGFRALCITGEMSWSLGGLTDPAKVVEYETRLNQFFPGSRAYAICQYDERKFTTDLLVRVIASHPFLVIGTEPYNNYYYIPPEIQLSPDSRVLYRHILSQLEERRRVDRQLERRASDLESFSYSVSHDLRAPLHTIRGFVDTLAEEDDRLSPQGREALNFIEAATQRMKSTIDNLLRLATVKDARLERRTVDVSDLANEVVARLRKSQPDRDVDVRVEPGLKTEADLKLLEIALENLLSNAWKFTRRTADARIEVGATEREGIPFMFVRDNGAGFDMRVADRLFQPFQRFHRQPEFEGHGIGLATVDRVVSRHGGRLFAEAAPNEGATFYFSLSPGRARAEASSSA